MKPFQISELKEVSNTTTANDLLGQGWRILDVFSVPRLGGGTQPLYLMGTENRTVSIDTKEFVKKLKGVAA